MEATKITPWVVVAILQSSDGKIVFVRDSSGRIILPRKDGGTLAQDIEFSPEETLEKILKENYIECSKMDISIVETKKIPDREKIFLKVAVKDLRIMSPNSHAGLYFPSDVFSLPSKKGDKIILERYL